MEKLQGVLYEEESIRLFLAVTVVMGGWAAWMTGKACASTWRPYWTVFLYMLVLGAVVRYLHFALFGGTLLSAQFYLVDMAVAQVFAAIGYRQMRTRQMVTKYNWLYAPLGPLSWRSRV